MQIVTAIVAGLLGACLVTSGAYVLAQPELPQPVGFVLELVHFVFELLSFVFELLEFLFLFL